MNACRPLRRAAARLVRDRLHDAGREPLGAPGVAARAPEPRARPVEAAAGAWELRLSRWQGDAPEARALDELGLQQAVPPRLRPADVPRPARLRLGARRRRAPRSTAYGRNIYLDTLNSAYGPGWRRENSFLSHKASGCSATASTRTTRIRATRRSGKRPEGKGERYRATVVGPGVLPDVTWEGAAPAAYDAALDRQLLDASARSTAPTPAASPSRSPYDRRRAARAHRRPSSSTWTACSSTRSTSGTRCASADRGMGRPVHARGAGGDDGHELARVVSLPPRDRRVPRAPRRDQRRGRAADARAIRGGAPRRAGAREAVQRLPATASPSPWRPRRTAS